jgi:hypothetical protein
VVEPRHYANLVFHGIQDFLGQILSVQPLDRHGSALPVATKHFPETSISNALRNLDLLLYIDLAAFCGDIETSSTQTCFLSTRPSQLPLTPIALAANG